MATNIDKEVIRAENEGMFATQPPGPLPIRVHTVRVVKAKTEAALRQAKIRLPIWIQSNPIKFAAIAFGVGFFLSRALDEFGGVGKVAALRSQRGRGL